MEIFFNRPKSDKKKEEKITAPAEKTEREKPVSPVRSPILKTLLPPKIPEIGGFLDVIVVMAASPCNFIVTNFNFCRIGSYKIIITGATLRAEQ
jgi:hypothetical protein